ncbi:hypothetical protein VNO77_24600 [Canavalia gladiata]|uniref:Uncharacterized protein n=1 Tax=Canavalia gladiata TaxID=3824 RepID=A0AAN9L7C4_CANGL
MEFVFVLFWIVKSGCCTSLQSLIPTFGVTVRLSTPTLNHTLFFLLCILIFIYLYLCATSLVGALHARQLLISERFL